MIAPQTRDIGYELEREFGSGLTLKHDVSARTLTTFGLGGAAQILLEIQQVETLQGLLPWLNSHGLTWRTLGAGSDVIFHDEGLPQPVIRLGRAFNSYTKDESSEGCIVRAQASTSLMSLSRELSQAGFTGLEFAAGIPASLGGAVVMNAGAHGHSMSEVIRRVTVVNAAGKLSHLDAAQLKYSYRHSEIRPDEIVVGAELELRRGEVEAIRRNRASCLDYRRSTQPLNMPSAGSVFRNPSHEDLLRGKIGEPEAAAVLLERAGLKGMRQGGVGYSEMHSNWLVRLNDDAHSAEACALIQLGIESVEQQFGVRLTPEIIFWS